MNKTNGIWQCRVDDLLVHYDIISSPRGMEVKEVIGGGYLVPMPAYLDLVDRKINTGFMFAEAHWICSGNNRLSALTPHIKGYARYSDDGVFLRGAYGPKVVDQLGYVVDTLVEDNDSRQAVLTIWRERPGTSKDIPCTVMMQFLIRGGKLHMVSTMRSHDIVLGFTYDVFTFSMVAMSVLLLLKERGINVELGNLHVNAGSLHLYSDYYERAATWVKSTERDLTIQAKVEETLKGVKTYEELLDRLLKASQI
jgi:thymidylate synthase